MNKHVEWNELGITFEGLYKNKIGLKKTKMKKLRFLLLPASIWVCSQEVDTLKIQELPEEQLKVQTYTLKDGSVRTYPKPKLLDFVTKLPRNFINTNKDFVAKDHAYYLGGALVATLILIPVDQKLTDNSREIAGKWG